MLFPYYISRKRDLYLGDETKLWSNFIPFFLQVSKWRNKYNFLSHRWLVAKTAGFWIS